MGCKRFAGEGTDFSVSTGRSSRVGRGRQACVSFQFLPLPSRNFTATARTSERKSRVKDV